MQAVGLTVQDYVQIATTLIIALSAVSQAVFIRKQSRLLERADERETKAVTKITFASARVDDTEFEGFRIANLSHFPITISSWHLEVEQEEKLRYKGTWILPEIRATKDLGGVPVSTLNTPHKLERGDVASVLVDKEQAREELVRADGEVKRVRAVFQDTIGNTYRSHGWVEWRQGGSVAHYGGPSPGYVSVEETQLRRRKTFGLRKGAQVCW